MSSPPYTQIKEVVGLRNHAAPSEMDASSEISFNNYQQSAGSQPPQIGKIGNLPMTYFRSPASAPVVYSEYKAGHSKFLGIAQIVIGSLCIVLKGTILAVHHYSPMRYVYFPYEICLGILFVVSGSVGIPSGALKTRGLVITFMVLCSISALGAAAILILSAVYLRLVETDGYYETPRTDLEEKFNYDAGLSIYSLLIFLSVLEGIFSIWGIFICGIVISCCREKSSTPSESISAHYPHTPMAVPLVDTAEQNHQSSNQRIGPNIDQEFLVSQSAQVANANGSSQVIYSGSSAPLEYNEPRAVESKFLGIAQIIIGIMCIVMYVASDTVSRRIPNDIQFPEVALSTGIIFIITGSFAFPAEASKQKGFLITFLVLSVISLVGSSMLLIMNTVLIFMKAIWPCYWRCAEYGDPTTCAFYSLLIILAIFEEICSIWSTAICSQVIGCCPAKATDQTELIPPPYSQTSVVATLIGPAPQNQQSSHQGINPNIGQACLVSQPPQIENSGRTPQKLYYGRPASVVYSEYRAVQSKFLGIVQLMIGISCVIIYVTSLVVLYIYDDRVYIEYPEFDLISGVFFIITGSLAFPAGASKQKGFIITFMVLSIISIVGSSLLLILNEFVMFNLVVETCYYRCSAYDSISLSFYCLLVLLSIFELIGSIWGTVICGKVIGCCDTKTTIQNSIPPEQIMFRTTIGYPQAFIMSDPNISDGPILNYGPPNQYPVPAGNVEKVNSNTDEKVNLVNQ